ncbi:MAG: Rne/Rng family ribonuclease [Opitutales bacterium]|nr:Rne/Rng family ribonuclease [Opitutales bacterium]MCH8540330.1 Rne/Rng family ribonuclease [Opitutales bacterium]
MKQESSSNSPKGDVSDRYTEELQGPPPEEAAEPVDTDNIRQEAQKRSRKKPFIHKIIDTLRGEKKSFRELIINSEPLERRVALLEDGILEKFEVERVGEDRLVGSIYKGKIQNLEDGLKAAFVDIGMAKNAFLHYWDMLPAANDSTIEVVRVNSKDKGKKKPPQTKLKDIPSKYPVGSDIVVQVTKGPIGTKGPRTTTNLSLPGRFLVLLPYSDQCGISRKIEDSRERSRLKKILRELTIPEGMGVIMRTAGEGKKPRYFVRDLHLLLKKWEEINNRMESEKGPVCLHQEPDIIERTVRDFLTEEIDRVLVDKDEELSRMQDIVAQISRRSKGKITPYKENIPIFERFNIERQIEQTFQRQAPLPSGGAIVIEETEALIAIDVNTGSHRARKGDNKNTILQVNLEAAVEVARQIQLRNIGGLIIIDFIDMKNAKDRKAVFNRMRQAMAEDKAKNHILPISQLGIMQMTRQRQNESLASGMYTDCPYCRGRGIVKSARSMSVEIQRRLVSVLRRQQNKEGKREEWGLRILVHPSILERLRLEDEQLLANLQDIYGVKLAFRADPSYHVENFKIIDPDSGQEYR